MHRQKNPKSKKRLLLLLIIVILVPLGIALATRLEGEKPQVTLEPDLSSLGVKQTLTLSVSDQKSGLRRIWLAIDKDGQETVLLERRAPWNGILLGGMVRDENLQVEFEPKKLGLTDGKATLRLMAADFSWRGWLGGNRTYIEKQVHIDTVAPRISVLTHAHNLTQGGAGMIVYRLSETCPESGVQVGDQFYPGYKGHFKSDDKYMAFFALRFDQTPDTKMVLRAVDAAGNAVESGFPHYIRKKRFRNDKLNISDRFLNSKLPDFSAFIADKDLGTSKDKFLYINRDLRRYSYEQVHAVTRQSADEILWEGAFTRFPNSARKAGFADHREYLYNGEIVDQQVHLGIDLAAVAQAQVPAGNTGKVVFAGEIGIYGQTVVLDHGFGLFSMYSHLSQIGVSQGQNVSKDDIIGRTGTTGLAGGDHLHFGMMVNQTYVNPIEWWDPAWIKNNVTDKMADVEAGS